MRTVTLLVPLLLLACGARSQLDVPGPNEASPMAPRSPHLDARFTHACHVDGDGSTRCWGRNTRGALGPGVERALTPVEVDLGGFVVAVSVGQSHTCGQREDGDVACVGHVGALSAVDGPRVALSGVVAVGSSLTDVCGITTAGGVICADGGPIEGVEDAVALEGGDAHLCALESAGTVRCWGDGAHGQLGGHPSSEAAAPVLDLPPAVAISSGDRHVCALDPQGRARCWGTWDGRLRSRPETIGAPPARAVLARGPGTICLGLETGEVRCNRRYLDEPSPGECLYAIEDPLAEVAGLRGAAALTGHAYGLCAETEEGVACWGCNHHGTVGDGTTTLRPTPTLALRL